MKLQKDSFRVKVYFEKSDWGSGCARPGIKLCKELGGRCEGPPNWGWHLPADPKTLKALEEHKAKYEEDLTDRLQLDAFSQKDFDKQFDEAEKKHDKGTG